MTNNLSFSQRRGFEPIAKDMQIDSIDDDLKNGIWNSLIKYYWDSLNRSTWISDNLLFQNLFRDIWEKFRKQSIDTLDNFVERTYDEIRKFYFDELQWNRTYDFIEFIAKNFGDEKINASFRKCCNETLEKEFSGYRFVGKEITPITSHEEIAEINLALKAPLQTVSDHLSSALSLLSDKTNPNYRNSIKESVSAVEAICQTISGKESATLGDALNIIHAKQLIELPQPLRDAYNKIYGYTSSKDGIRHALSEESTLNADDARYMLISCSAFVNYLISKSNKAGIKLK